MSVHITATILTVLILLASGCASPPPKPAYTPDRQRAAQIMASKGRADASGLDWEPFPDLKNPLHAQIWNALLKKKVVGDDGFGRICNYYGLYLVTVSEEGSGAQSFSSYFYEPKNHLVYNANEEIASTFYGGARETTMTNILSLVHHVLAINGFQTLIVSNAADIPHTEFTKDNPGLSFTNWLFSKGIVISPPALIRRNEHYEVIDFSEYNVFVYMPVGGQLFRYEVHCRDGRIGDLRRYLIGSNIGDAWYLM